MIVYFNGLMQEIYMKIMKNLM